MRLSSSVWMVRRSGRTPNSGWWPCAISSFFAASVTSSFIPCAHPPLPLIGVPVMVAPGIRALTPDPEHVCVARGRGAEVGWKAFSKLIGDR